MACWTHSQGQGDVECEAICNKIKNKIKNCQWTLDHSMLVLELEATGLWLWHCCIVILQSNDMYVEVMVMPL